MEALGERVRLLVVEDDERVAHAFARSLAADRANIDVEIALTVGEALVRIARPSRVDCIFLDLLMPDERGERVIDVIEAADYPSPPRAGDHGHRGPAAPGGPAPARLPRAAQADDFPGAARSGMDFSATVQGLLAEQPELVFLATYFTDGARIATELQQRFTAGYRPQILGWRFHMFERFITSLPPAVAEEMIGFAPRPPDNDPAYAAFAAAYRNAFGAAPPLFAEGAYDAVYALALAAARAGRAERSALLETLRVVASPPGEKITVGGWAAAAAAIRAGRDVDYDGASGPIDWDAHGWPATSNAVVWTVRSGRIEVIGTAPL